VSELMPFVVPRRPLPFFFLDRRDDDERWCQLVIELSMLLYIDGDGEQSNVVTVQFSSAQQSPSSFQNKNSLSFKDIFFTVTAAKPVTSTKVIITDGWMDRTNNHA